MAINDNWLAAGNTARSMLGLPMVAPYTVGQRWAEALRESAGARHAAFTAAFPLFSAYTEEMDAAGEPYGAASGERAYGCPLEWAADAPEYARAYSDTLRNVTRKP